MTMPYLNGQSEHGVDTPMGSQAKREANRRNSQKSTGPRSAAGKARSKLNALKHGMTAESVLLPGEDADAFQARLQYLQNDLQPRNHVEAGLLYRLACEEWFAERIELASAARVEFRLRHEL